ncbi:MAG: hypothetical protein KHY19_16960 [Coprobacillus cateniformis]|nr:hypothetical protein [Coprobacillus cateniformis]
MAETIRPILSAIGTVASKLPDLSIKNGQLIFIQDSQKIALDFNDKRVFYNQVVILQKESDREAILAPINELFYFVVDTAVLWMYHNEWVQITSQPENIVFIGTTLPELGSAKTLYVNKEEQNISIWDSESSEYIVVGNTYSPISNNDILSLFK